jgi:hypothetical protein
MRWRRAFAAYLVWLVAHTVAGTVFALVGVPPFSSTWWFILEGLFAGIVFGSAQWLALRPFLPNVGWWAPATIAASPVSWWLGTGFAFATLGLGGWLGGGFSAAGQCVVLARSMGRNSRLAKLSALWIPASMIGGAIFYFCYYVALSEITSLPRPSRPPSPSPFELTLGGSLAFAIVTGLVVALMAGLVAPHAASRPAISDPSAAG